MRKLSFDLTPDAERIVVQVWSTLAGHPAMATAAVEVAIGLLARAVPGLITRERMWALGEIARILSKEVDE